MKKARKFVCTEGYGLLGGKEALVWYTEKLDKWIVEINETQMVYANEKEFLEDLKNANFKEVI